MAEPPPIRILVADDHPVVRDGLVAILSTQPDFAILKPGRAEAVRQALDLRPDVLLLDLEMPGLTALGCKPAGGQVPRNLVFTAYDTDERISPPSGWARRAYLKQHRGGGLQRGRVIAAGGRCSSRSSP
jgi:CheY-like chemotaxis protein